MDSPTGITPSIVAPHKPVDIHVPHPSSVLRYSNTTSTTSHPLKSSLSFSLNQGPYHGLPLFTHPSHLLLNSSSDESDTDEEEDVCLDDSDDQIDASDDGSDTEVDYVYSPFGRPPSRLGHRVSPTTKKQLSNNRRNKSHISIERLKVDNSFLKNQNAKLLLEIEHSRSTIQALRNIVNQKDLDLQNVRNENRFLEALIRSKHAKDGSIIVRSGGDGAVNGSDDKTKEPTRSNKESSSALKCQQKQPTKSIPESPQPSSSKLSATMTIENPSLLQHSPSTVDSPKPPLPPLSPKRKKQRRWSMDFGPQNPLTTDESSDDQDADTSASSRRHPASSTSSSTIYTNDRRSTSSSRSVPRLIKRKTGDIIQSLASCRPTSTKNGYDYSPSCSPTLVRSDTSDDEYEDNREEEVECEDIDEKSQKQRRLGHRLFGKIFSSSSSSSTTAAAARGPLSR
ncbi:18163_t:CDS:1 [Acaulospora morrowiae]|uniref:18163_t:CDS:1 n=1 Tax=Acaulospora morrowiae TaxID=94023 RepID=A0A9N9F6C3_9GLOM|nr:18163_t:CDS:1 [Acaulospora morrowiae]